MMLTTVEMNFIAKSLHYDAYQMKVVRVNSLQGAEDTFYIFNHFAMAVTRVTLNSFIWSRHFDTNIISASTTLSNHLQPFYHLMDQTDQLRTDTTPNQVDLTNRLFHNKDSVDFATILTKPQNYFCFCSAS